MVVLINTLEDKYEALDRAHPGATWIVTHSSNVTAWIRSLQGHLSTLHSQGNPESQHWSGGRSFLHCRMFGCRKGIDSPSDDPRTLVRVDPRTGKVLEGDLARLASAYELYYRRLFDYLGKRDYAYVDVRAGIYRRVNELLHSRVSTPFAIANAQAVHEGPHQHCKK